ncbi:MAG: hypothetical protein HQK72_11740 [Desulfamplus sp.]|nr:hypothetical protein [Desulfamplus sp.]
MIDILYIFLAIIFLTGLFMYLFGLILESKAVRDSLTNFWLKNEFCLEKVNFLEALKLSKNIISTIYEDNNNKISFFKILILTLLLNLFFFWGIYLSNFTTIIIDAELSPVTVEDQDYFLYGCIAMTIFGLIISYINEFISVAIIRFSINLSIKKENFKSIIYGSLLLIIVFYILPLPFTLSSEYYSHIYKEIPGIKWLFLLFMLTTTLMQQMLFLGFITNHILCKNYCFLLMIPSVFSVAFPMLIVILSLLLKNNHIFLKYISKIIEKIELVQYSKVKNSGLILCALSSGAISVISYRI